MDAINQIDQKENKLNISQILILLIKTAVIVLLVFFAMYGLNQTITDFLADERANEDYEILDHYDGQFQEIYEKRVNADYIFLGTSHFTHGVTPEEFEISGKKFFNFALNGSNPSYYVWWYHEVFKANNYVKPQAVIFGVDWFMFDTDWLWRKPDFDYRYLRETSGDSDATNKYNGKWYDIDEVTTYITNRFAVFSSRSRIIDIILPDKKEKEPKEFNRTPDGFRIDLFYKGFIPWENDFNGNSVGRVMTRYKEVEKEAFLSLLDEFKDEGIPVVFAMAPEYLPGREAPQFDQMNDTLIEIANDYNIPFLNYNTDLAPEINGDYTCYSDWGHLNEKGAHLFSQKLYGDLNEILAFDK